VLPKHSVFVDFSLGVVDFWMELPAGVADFSAVRRHHSRLSVTKARLDVHANTPCFEVWRLHDDDMQVLVLGATGGVGRLIVEEALKRGHEVTALVRTPDKLGAVANRVSVIRGDALDPDSVSRAVAGQHAVLYALGAGNVRHTTLFSESTRVLLPAMQRNAVRRLICVTGVGAGETKGHGGFLYDHILYPLFTKRIYADKDKQEGLIRQSPLDWTIVRPASFRERAPTGSLQVVTNVEGVTLRRISRHEVARFVLDVLEQNQYVRQAVFIGHP